jgi:GDPmannose 4,6-dehydratase
MNRIALIIGISGQDGSYLAKHLVNRGYTVYGTSRNIEEKSFWRLIRLDVLDAVEIIRLDVKDFQSVYQIVSQLLPDEIYYLAGQTSVRLSQDYPRETFESNAIGAINVLESIRQSGKNIKLFNACSSECFGETELEPADEETLLAPQNMYAVSKAASYWATKNYRNTYGLFACSGILFNHESPLRSERFVTQKIATTAVAIYRGIKTSLILGNLDIERDWGWAPEYVEAMHAMLQQQRSSDYILATGNSHTLSEFVEFAFEEIGLNHTDYVRHSDEFDRPNEINISRGKPEKAKQVLGWTAKYGLRDIARAMVRARLEEN